MGTAVAFRLSAVVHVDEKNPPPALTRKPRAPVALRAWVMNVERSDRGFVLDLSETGCRVGCAGMLFACGEDVVVKIALDDDEVPWIARGFVARYQPVLAKSGAECPQMCLTFRDVPVDVQDRLDRFLAALRRPRV